VINTQCFNCKHYWGIGGCEAYPDGIPDAIVTGIHDHTKPFPGDNGIRFNRAEPVKGEDRSVGYG
jgi:hypothetical protein